MWLMRFLGGFLLASALFILTVPVANASSNDHVCSGLSTALSHVTNSVASAHIQSQMNAFGCGGSSSSSNSPAAPSGNQVNPGRASSCDGLAVAYANSSADGKAHIQDELNAFSCGTGQPAASTGGDSTDNASSVVVGKSAACHGLWTGYAMAGPLGDQYIGYVILTLGC